MTRRKRVKETGEKTYWHVLKELVEYAYSHDLVTDSEMEVIRLMMKKKLSFWEEIARGPEFEEKLLAMGREQGAESGKLEVVKNALSTGLEVDVIAKISGLSEQAILDIQANLTK